MSAGASDVPSTTGRDSGARGPGEMGQGRSHEQCNNAVLGDEVPASIQGYFRAPWDHFMCPSYGLAGCCRPRSRMLRR